ncbi:Bis(5'-nucleosyl)-tetraphosphatase, symmetrical [Yarrowia sp. C11]|nr:Bis(5'-nucleosyl)-tetraphosphatase, symmetrical [Yarrowia sp. C11]KAG5371254.1 Bis(5'-nucleosyl)-tetraphosphatase, symmetrical [Yarrowia sp. E02]
MTTLYSEKIAMSLEQQPLLDTQPKKSRVSNIWGKLFALVVLLTFAASSYVVMSLSMTKPKYPNLPNFYVVEDMDPKLIPSHEDDTRLILIGDIHGSFKQLKHLLEKADYNKKKDQLFFLGDFISKGEDSQGVVDFAMEHNALCVRGNHEDKLVVAYEKYHHLHHQKTVKTPGGKHITRNGPANVLADEDDLSEEFSAKQMEYIASCPAIMRLGDISETGNLAVAVHAGLMWNVPRLEDQDPDAVMRMRSLLPPKDTVYTEDDDGVPWFEVWNDKIEDRAKKDRMTIFYGHDARQGLQLTKYTRGLDSGCVKGGKLNAMIITQKKNGKFAEELVRVSCKELE